MLMMVGADDDNDDSHTVPHPENSLVRASRVGALGRLEMRIVLLLGLSTFRSDDDDDGD